MTEASKQRMENGAVEYAKTVAPESIEQWVAGGYRNGYQAGMLDLDAGKKEFFCCGGSDEHPPEHTQDCDTRLIEKLEAENKKLREALWDLRNGMVNVHNILLDYYSEGREYWETPNIAFKKSKEALEKLKESKALSSGGSDDSRGAFREGYRSGMQDPDAVGILEENKRLKEGIDFAIGHLSSMENYSIVSGAIHALKESKGGE